MSAPNHWQKLKTRYNCPECEAITWIYPNQKKLAPNQRYVMWHLNKQGERCGMARKVVEA